jgi:malonate-semialdehyde dehydrogenase (acetylating)/methylmalonate-semialdehyde dehydrogenase
MVVLPDADMDLAADAAVSAAYGSAGERCMAISVLVTVGTRPTSSCRRSEERIAKLKVGDGLDPASQMGPLVTRQHLDKVRGLRGPRAREGRELLVDGRTLKVKGRREWLLPRPDALRPGDARR